jgi:hypothetical protein
MNSFKLLEFKRKLKVFSFVEGFFESHSRKKDKNRAKEEDFFSKLKKFKRV